MKQSSTNLLASFAQAPPGTGLPRTGLSWALKELPWFSKPSDTPRENEDKETLQLMVYASQKLSVVVRQIGAPSHTALTPKELPLPGKQQRGDLFSCASGKASISENKVTATLLRTF